MVKKTNIGRRFLAGLIDYSIIWTVSFLIIMILGTPNDEGTYELAGLPAIIPVLYWFLMIVVIESTFGATIGNTIMGLKPVPLNNHNSKISFSQSLRRHLLDVVDMIFFGIVGIVTIKNSEHHQRVGDIWAGTTVIRIKNNTR